MKPPSLPPSRALASSIQKMGLYVGLGFLVLLLRLWDLQILEGGHYFTLSTNNHLRLRPVEAPRGFILDRHGKILVENRPTFDLYATPEDVTNPAEVSGVLAKILGSTPDEIQAEIAEGRTRPYQPLLLRKDLDEPTMVAVEERQLDLPGISLRIRPIRSYPSGGMAANLLGYVSEVNQAELQREDFQDFRPGESLGQSGVERRYDGFIRGLDGGEEIEVDARGRALRIMSRIEPHSGDNIYLTIDKRIQEAAETAFAGKKGAVIAMNPATGEILAMVSRPSYDPNLFAQRLTGEEWKKLANDATHPMSNRAFQAQYPPGSIFKLMVTIAGLESGALTPETKFNCPEHFYLGTAKFDDWKKGGFGVLDLKSAITHSANVYFYQAGLRVGIDPIVRTAKAFGLGEPPGLGLWDEVKGNLPNPQPRRGGQPGWTPGNTVISSIGQGPVVTSPMQLLIMVSAIANGGTIYRPWVVKKVVSLAGEVLEEYEPQAVRHVPVKPETLTFVQQAMLSVVEGGTGAKAKVPGVLIAGKTGTAQVVKKGDEKGHATLKDHGWFVSFAPVDNPRIAVVVLVENGGFGGQVAAPVAKAMYEAAFSPVPAPAAPGTAEAGDPNPED